MAQKITIGKQSSNAFVEKALREQHYSVTESHVMMYLIFLILKNGQYDQNTQDYFTFFNPRPLASYDHVSLHRIKVAFQQLVDRDDVKVNYREHAKNQVFIKRFQIVRN